VNRLRVNNNLTLVLDRYGKYEECYNIAKDVAISFSYHVRKSNYGEKRRNRRPQPMNPPCGCIETYTLQKISN
jgi:hypothetical protein